MKIICQIYIFHGKNIIKKQKNLQLKFMNDGWEFNQVVCIAKGGMRVGDVFARILMFL